MTYGRPILKEQLRGWRADPPKIEAESATRSFVAYYVSARLQTQFETVAWAMER